jgi:DivIVA domain-containing protein
MPFFPEEIASKTFPTSSGDGYDPTEVAAFLSEVAHEYRMALEWETTDDPPVVTVSKSSAEIWRSAAEWAERHVVEAEAQARAIVERAESRFNDLVHRAEEKEAMAYEAARRRADTIISEAKSQSKALLESARRPVDQLTEYEEKQPGRLSAKRQQLLDEVNTVQKITLRLRTDFVESKDVSAIGDETLRVLVVSSDDRSLAPMAAALLKRALVERGCTWAEVSSAGISARPGDPPDEQVVSFLAARGIDISAHRSRVIDAGEVLQADLVVAMTQAERKQILQRVPDANAVLLKEMQEVSVNGSRSAAPRERIRAFVAQAVRDGDGYDLETVGVWPLLYHQCLDEMAPAIDALASALAGDSSDLGTERTIKPAQVAAEPTLFDWFRHYGAFIALLVLVGVAGAMGYIVLGPRPYEASTLVVDRGRNFSARQLALVSQATFQSPAVIAPTLSKLNMDISSQEFLDETVDLRPIPDTNTLMVIGRSNSLSQAEAISEAVTDSFVSASNSRTDLTDFVVFGRSQAAPVQQNIAPSVAIGLGASVGFWFGIAIAVVHFRLKRPVLAFARALTVSGADRVTIVDGKWSWLGMLRPRPSRSPPRLARARRKEDDSSFRAQPINWFGDGNGMTRIVAHSGTQERELGLARFTPVGTRNDARSRDVELVWLR